MSASYGVGSAVKRAKRAATVLGVVLIAMIVALAGCVSAPDPAPVSLILDMQAEALTRARANTTRNLTTLAGRLKAENAARIEARFVARLGVESRPTDEVLAEVAARDAALAASASEVDAALAKALADENFDAAEAANGVAQDYVDEITERQRAEAKLRAMLGVKPR